jgi:transcriptional regulator with XRE-family HTH domain
MLTQRLYELRKEHGFNQAEVARHIGVSRATYANYESGETEPKLSELIALANLFNTSIDNMADSAGAGDVQLIFDVNRNEFEQQEICFDPTKFREVLLYCIDKVGGKANIGETALYKLLYFIDTDYYEQYGKSITGLSYVKQKHGPTPVQGEFLPAINALKERSELVTKDVQVGDYRQKKYLPTIEVTLEYLSARELNHINWELERLGSKSAGELTWLSHQDTPWIASKMGASIDYQLVMYRTAVTRTRELDDDL